MTAPEPGPPDPAAGAITASTFRALVASYLRKLEQGEDLSADDYITAVRLFNTIEHDRRAESDELCARYASAFFPAHVDPAAKRLGAVLTKGMALYSPEYDLYIGGPRHSRSEYQIGDDG
jgi:hypothetical protein